MLATLLPNIGIDRWWVQSLETYPAWARALQPLRSSYPNVVDAVRTNVYGMTLFSRSPLAEARV